MAFENEVIGSMGTLIYVSNVPNDAQTREDLLHLIPRVPTGVTETSKDFAALKESIITSGNPGWVRVGGVVDGGTYGGTYELFTEAQLHNGEQMKAKTVKDPGSASLNCLVLPRDPGQLLLKKYADLRSSIAVLYIIGNPSVTEDGWYPTLEMAGSVTDPNSALFFDFMPALVMGWETQVGSATDAVHANPELQVTRTPLRLERGEDGRIEFPTTGDGVPHPSWLA
jgi:hypothetical protein